MINRRLCRRQSRLARSITALLLVLVGLLYAALVQLDLLPLLIRREPAPFPPPAITRDERWQQDVAYLADQLPVLHRNAFFSRSAEAFYQQAAVLQAQVPTSSDVEIVLGMAALTASLGDSHTAVQLADLEQFHTFPLHLTWFGDDLVVVGAGPNHQEVLGARVTHIGNTPVAAALAAVAPFIAHDNDQQLRTASPQFLLTPEILAARNLLPDATTGRFQFETASGERLSLKLNPVPADTPVEIVPLKER